VLARVIAIVLACGCGRIGFAPTAGPIDGADDDASDGDALDGANDPNGFWIMTEVRVAGQPTVITRADLVAGLRADLAIAQGAYTARSIRLSGGVWTAPPIIELGQLAVVDGAWLFSSDAGVTVFAAEWEGNDEVVLRYELADPRNAGEPPAYDLSRLQRGISPPAALIGDWRVVATAYSGTGEIAAGSCGANPGGGSMRVTGTFDVSTAFVATAAFEFLHYADTACGGTPTPESDPGTVFFDRGSVDLVAWLETVESPPVVMAVTLLPTTAGWRLERTSCEPAGPCAVLPLMIEIEP
jgi:hypothetical protein